MRRAAKVDKNQPAIVDALRDIGAGVQPLHVVGDGCPDLLVGYQGQNYLLEVKNLKGRGNKLTDDQKIWHACWPGQKTIVISPEQAIAFITGEEHDQ